MVRSALVQPEGSEHLITQKQVMRDRDVTIFNELAKAVTMAAEPWLRETLRREVLADTSSLRFLPLTPGTEKKVTFRNWLIELTGDTDEVLLLRMAQPHAQYLAGDETDEAEGELTTLVRGWTQLWFATVGQLLGWYTESHTSAVQNSISAPEELLPWGKEDLAAILTCGWTFADGGVILLECWMPIGFVGRITARLVSGDKGRDTGEHRNLRASVVRAYRREGTVRSGQMPVLPVRFPALEETTTAGEGSGMELVQDVFLDVAAELAKTEMKIGQLLELKIGDVVELGKMAGEPMELSLNGHNIARGEVLVLDEQLGIRISEVISLADRLEKAQG